MSGRDPGHAASEPDGRFHDAASPRAPAAERPIYKLLVRAEPGVDDTRALRHLLKAMLRRFGLKCMAVSIEKSNGGNG